MSTADELAKLDHLRKTGVLSDQEFEQEKAKMLAGQLAPTAAPRSARRRQPHVKLALVVAVIAIIVVAIATRGGGPSAKYRTHVLSAIAIDSQEMTIDFAVTNIGKGSGTPSCNLTANSPGDTDTGTDVVTPVRPVTPGETARFTDTLTITHNSAHNVLLSGVHVSCS